MFFVGGKLWLFVIILVVWAISGSILRPTLKALIANAAPGGERGAILGFADSLNNASMIVAPTTAGAILGYDPAAIGIVPALALAGAFIMGMRGPRRAERPRLQWPAIRSS
jgi:MFS family permease